MTESQQAKIVAHWVLTDKFDKLENWEWDNGCITAYLDEMWAVFENDTYMSTLLEKAYNKWTAEY